MLVKWSKPVKYNMHTILRLATLLIVHCHAFQSQEAAGKVICHFYSKYGALNVITDDLSQSSQQRRLGKYLWDNCNLNVKYWKLPEMDNTAPFAMFPSSIKILNDFKNLHSITQGLMFMKNMSIINNFQGTINQDIYFSQFQDVKIIFLVT